MYVCMYLYVFVRHLVIRETALNPNSPKDKHELQGPVVWTLHSGALVFFLHTLKNPKGPYFRTLFDKVRGRFGFIRYRV